MTPQDGRDQFVEPEVPLSGGRLTSGVVRVADTVRRPTGPHSPFVHRLMRHLAWVGFEAAPRLLGRADAYGLPDTSVLLAAVLRRQEENPAAALARSQSPNPAVAEYGRA